MSEQCLALIIDDEETILELVEYALDKMSIAVCKAHNVAEAKACLQRQRFNLCLTDMRLPDGSGLDVIDYIQAQQLSLPVAVITAFGNMELAVTALKAGAFDFVSKPVDLESLRSLVSQAIKLPEESHDADLSQYGLIGKSAAIKELSKKIVRVARSQAPVYVTGDSGTGKELVARLIHQLGPRSNGPFIPVNCGAISDNLIESELFGHVKGSFTGAVSDKPGLFQAAKGGSLFLDEVADLPLNMQVKLLRAIQEKAVRPVGAAKEVSVDVRIISATHYNLHEAVSQGDFRQDLFYRLNVIELVVPPLSERREDIALLVPHILQKLGAEHEQAPFTLTASALNALSQYIFPGNVRELENMLERALALSEHAIIDIDDLHLPTASEQQTQSTDDFQLEPYLDDLERQRIQSALTAANGNKAKAAELLGITLRALRYRVKRLGVKNG